MAMAVPLGLSYFDRVEDSQNQYPALTRLTDFRKAPAPYAPRLSVLEFSDCGVRDEPVKNVLELETYWSNQSSSGSACKGRLYVLEDLSAEYIEALGSHFNINPSFFVTHLYLPFFSKSDAAMMLERIPSRLISTQRANSTGFSLRYYELRRLKSHVKWDNAMTTTAANVGRRVLSIHPEDECSYGVILRNSSFWVPPSEEGYWHAVMLVDPPVGDQWALRDLSTFSRSKITSKSDAYLKGFAKFPFWPDNATSQAFETLLPSAGDSLFDETIAFWKFKASLLEVKSAISDPHVSTAITRQSIASAWSIHLEFITGVIGQLETRLGGFESMQDHQRSADDIKQELSELRSLMACVNRYRRRIWLYIDHMRCNLEALGQPPSSNSSNRLLPNNLTGNGDSVLEDFASFYDRLQYSKDRLESLMPVVMGASSLLETQQSALEARYVARLTSLATVFVPLSFLTGIFGMSGRYLPGEGHFWIFWAVSLPLVAISLAVVYATKYMRPGRGLSSNREHKMSERQRRNEQTFQRSIRSRFCDREEDGKSGGKTARVATNA